MDYPDQQQQQQQQSNPVMTESDAESPRSTRRGTQALTDAQRREILRRRRLASLKQRGDAFLRNPDQYHSPSLSSKSKTTDGSDDDTTPSTPTAAAAAVQETQGTRVLRLNDGPAKSPDVIGLFSADGEVITKDTVSPSLQELERRHAERSAARSSRTSATSTTTTTTSRFAPRGEEEEESASPSALEQRSRRYVRMIIVAAVSALLSFLHLTCPNHQLHDQVDDTAAAAVVDHSGFICEISRTVHPLVFFLTLQLMFHLPAVLSGIQTRIHRASATIGAARGMSHYGSASKTVIDTLLEAVRILVEIKTIVKHLCIFLIAYVMAAHVFISILHIQHNSNSSNKNTIESH